MADGHGIVDTTARLFAPAGRGSLHCLEFGSGCGVRWRALTRADELAKLCSASGDRFAEGPCTRDNARSFSGSGPACGGLLLWLYGDPPAQR